MGEAPRLAASDAPRVQRMISSGERREDFAALDTARQLVGDLGDRLPIGVLHFGAEEVAPLDVAEICGSSGAPQIAAPSSFSAPRVPDAALSVRSAVSGASHRRRPAPPAGSRRRSGTRGGRNQTLRKPHRSRGRSDRCGVARRPRRSALPRGATGACTAPRGTGPSAVATFTRHDWIPLERAAGRSWSRVAAR